MKNIKIDPFIKIRIKDFISEDTKKDNAIFLNGVDRASVVVGDWEDVFEIDTDALLNSFFNTNLLINITKTS